jgi:hypothetical protein
MKFQSLILTLGSLVILGLSISGCRPVNPTPALPEYQVFGTLTAQPSPSPTVLPDRLDELSCSQDSDCVLAYRTDQCCDCWSIYNQKTVDDNRNLRLLDEPPGYKYAKWRCPQKPCPFIACAPCFNPPYGLVCDNNICRGVETWQENLNACRGLQQEKQGYCFGNAAVIAYQSEGEEQASRVCKSLEGTETWGTPFSEECLLQVARLMMNDNPKITVSFCRSYMALMQSNCLNETALALGKTDVSAALVVCNEIIVNSDSDLQQKDFCFHNLAMSVAEDDLVQARQICEMVSGDVEQCKLEAEQVAK